MFLIRSSHRHIHIKYKLLLLIVVMIMGTGFMSFSRTYTYGKSELPANTIHTTQKDRYVAFLKKEVKIYKLSSYDMNILETIIYRESRWNMKTQHHNKDGSIDYGLFQINEYQQKYAINHTKLYDYKTNWVDNIKLGVYIYKTQGVRRWVSMWK